jgi:hypothetical protein
VRQGVDVVFTTCAQLTQSQNAARAIGAYERKLTSLAATKSKVPTTPNRRILDPAGMPVHPPRTGSNKPKTPGSFTAKSDKR